MGGGTFVMHGATLSLGGGLSVAGNTVTAGVGNASCGLGNASAFGAGVFLQGNGNLSLSPGTGRTGTISDEIGDRDWQRREPAAMLAAGV